MKQIIRLTESDLHRIVKEAVDGIYKMYSNTSPSPHHTVEYGIKKQTEKHRAESAKRRAERNNNKELETENTIISEDGEAGGGGATNAAGVMQGGGTNPGAGQYDVPAFAKKKQNKVGGNPFDEPIMRQKHNLGDVTSAPANQVDMKPALKRGGSIAMGENFERKINEAVDEGIGNWLKGAALGGMMAMSSPQEAQAQKYQYQENPYINGVEQVNHPYSQKYDISYDNEDSQELIYDLLRNNAQYSSKWGKGITPEIMAKIKKYPKYNMKTPVEAFLKSNQGLINRCGGNVGGIDSDVTFVYVDGSYYLVPSDINKL